MLSPRTLFFKKNRLLPLITFSLSLYIYPDKKEELELKELEEKSALIDKRINALEKRVLIEQYKEEGKRTEVEKLSAEVTKLYEQLTQQDKDIEIQKEAALWFVDYYFDKLFACDNANNAQILEKLLFYLKKSINISEGDIKACQLWKLAEINYFYVNDYIKVVEYCNQSLKELKNCATDDATFANSTRRDVYTLLAWVYFEGKNGVKKDIKKAEDFCKKGFNPDDSLSDNFEVYDLLCKIYTEKYGFQQGNERVFDYYYSHFNSENLTCNEIHQELGDLYRGDNQEFVRNPKEALYHYQLIAQLDNYKTQYINLKQIGMIFFYADDQKNLEQAQKYFEQALLGAKNAGDITEELDVRTRLTDVLFEQKNYKAGMEHLIFLSQQKENTSIAAFNNYRLGWCYFHGLGIPVDGVKARDYFLNAISLDEGNSFMVHCSHFFLGELYFYSNSAFKDYQQAFKHFNESIKKGNNELPFFFNAYNNLGIMYAHGMGVEQNIDEAEKMFKIALDSRNKYLLADVYHCLSKLYLYQGNFPLSRQYLKKSADQRDDEYVHFTAFLELGHIEFHNCIATRMNNFSISEKYLKPVAQQDKYLEIKYRAQLYLAEIALLNRRSVKAKTLFQKVAEQKDIPYLAAIAYVRIGEYYEKNNELEKATECYSAVVNNEHVHFFHKYPAQFHLIKLGVIHGNTQESITHEELQNVNIKYEWWKRYPTSLNCIRPSKESLHHTPDVSIEFKEQLESAAKKRILQFFWNEPQLKDEAPNLDLLGV